MLGELLAIVGLATWSSLFLLAPPAWTVPLRGSPQIVSAPVVVTGSLGSAMDVDSFGVLVSEGETLEAMHVSGAARAPRIEIHDGAGAGERIGMVLVQAGDSKAPRDYRIRVRTVASGAGDTPFPDDAAEQLEQEDNDSMPGRIDRTVDAGVGLGSVESLALLISITMIAWWARDRQRASGSGRPQGESP